MTRQCCICEKRLTGGLDTFGDPQLGLGEFCEQCWRDFQDNMPEGDFSSWYGLAPHHHDFDLTGSIFGSTVFDGIPEDNRDADGWYKVEEGLYFRPDPEAPGCGEWEDRR